MSADIGPGDFVEFVGPPRGHTPAPSGFGLSRLVPGAVYRVTEVGRRCADGAGRVWDSLRVAGMVTVSPVDGHPISVPVAAFRPIYRPKSIFIEQLTAPAPSEREPSLTPV